MAGNDDEFKPGPDWEGKTGFAVGVPEDLALLPTVHYQVLHGKVYTLTRWPDESTARGEMTLAELEARFGRQIVKEGWYDVLGEYVGATLSLD